MLYDTKHSTVHIDNDHLKVSLAAMVTPATPCSPVPGTQMVTVQSSQYRTLAITIWYFALAVRVLEVILR